MPNILIIDDELSIRESFALILEGKYHILLAASGEAALKTIAEQKADLAFLDIRMPGMDGLETLKKLKALDPDLEVIMVTAVNDVQKAGEAIKNGARDYVIKPFDIDHIAKLAEQVLRKKSLRQEGALIQKNIGRDKTELIGRHEKIGQLLKRVHEIKEPQRVLIIGAVGTEKELVARLIHDQSTRCHAKFQAARLSSQMSAATIKNLFFGREKGHNLTDLTAKTGLLEEVSAGTIFIDNLQYLPDEVFKAIASGSFVREGSSTKLEITARLIGGASPDLAEQNKGLFEFFADIYLEVPSLNQRSSDLPILIGHFLEFYNERYNKNCRLTTEVSELLNNYSWPGNTSQLASLIERLVLTWSGKPIEPKNLPLEILLADGQPLGRALIDTFEKNYINKVVANCGGDQARAAELLEINPTLLASRI